MSKPTGLSEGKINLLKQEKLKQAIGSGSVDLVRIALEDGADINDLSFKLPNFSNGNALHLSLSYGDSHLDIIKLFIGRGADVDKCSSNGATSLGIAYSSGGNATFELLVSKVQYVNQRYSYSNKTLLHNTYDSSQAAKLIEIGANVNAIDDEGYTPLHYAAYARMLESAGLLIDNKCLINVLDKSDRTPLDVAIISYDSELSDTGTDLLALLVENGAELGVAMKARLEREDPNVDPEITQFFEQRALLCRQKYLENQRKFANEARKEFTNELGNLFDEQSLSKLILFNFHYEGGQPIIHSKDLREITDIIAAASKEDRMNGALAKRLQALDNPLTRYFKDSYVPASVEQSAEATASSPEEFVKEEKGSLITKEREGMSARSKEWVDDQIKDIIIDYGIKPDIISNITFMISEGGSIASIVKHMLATKGSLSFIEELERAGVNTLTNLDTEDPQVRKAVNDELERIAASSTKKAEAEGGEGAAAGSVAAAGDENRLHTHAPSQYAADTDVSEEYLGYTLGINIDAISEVIGAAPAPQVSLDFPAPLAGQ